MSYPTMSVVRDDQLGSPLSMSHAAQWVGELAVASIALLFFVGIALFGFCVETYEALRGAALVRIRMQ